ncbi:MAG: hypothetical protein LBH44_06680 [Treponema sp.]|jgi:hypothetical protein|nr:hypothetical protein [Treponema sp.]
MKKGFIILGLLLVFVLMGCGTITTYTFGAVTDNTIEKFAEGPAEGGITAVARGGGINKIATVDLKTVETHWYWVTLFGSPSLVKLEQTWIVSGE